MKQTFHFVKRFCSLLYGATTNSILLLLLLLLFQLYLQFWLILLRIEDGYPLSSTQLRHCVQLSCIDLWQHIQLVTRGYQVLLEVRHLVEKIYQDILIRPQKKGPCTIQNILKIISIQILRRFISSQASQKIFCLYVASFIIAILFNHY